MGYVIPNPCSKKWTELVGDERRRFCGDCGKFVHAVDAHSAAELAELGSFCGYVRDKTAGPSQSRRMVMAGVLLTTISPLLAQNGRLRVEVRDASGAALEGATVRVGDRTAVADQAGVALFAELPAGRHEIRIDQSGFAHWTSVYTSGPGVEPVVRAVLQVGSVGSVHVVPQAATRIEAGRLRLEVLDPAGKPVSNAKVTIDCGLNRTFQVQSGPDGVGIMTELPEGKCVLTAVAAGFQPWELVHNIPGRGEGRVTAKLSLPVLAERVEVRPSAGRRFWNWMTSCTRR